MDYHPNTQNPRPSTTLSRVEPLFDDLISTATGKGRSCKRIVFFIDELDRCTKADVVVTLTSLRTFLDQPRCVFVVAADREVLEEALDEVEQSTPLRPDAPYYSTASAFLDKIFQHQLALPPLRSGRLTRFARTLVSSRGGLWKELRDFERDDRQLDDVLYTLIPPHVRSPRRVKVLLNNFATSARVAEARGLNWLPRSTEIAKLVVLQTEFPRLAADLRSYPRLIDLLLNPPSADSRSEQQQALLARHPLSADELATEDSADPDKILGNGDGDRDATAVRARQVDQLKRYLTSRAAPRFGDPGRDLLFLESAGLSTGITDEELSLIIEEEAATNPSVVQNAVESRQLEAAEILSSARLIGQISENEFGPERTNTITSLALVLAGTEPEHLRGGLGNLLSNVDAYRSSYELTDAQLTGLLNLAIAAGDQGAGLRSAVMTHEGLLDEADRVKHLVGLLESFSDSEAKIIYRAVAERFWVDPDLAMAILRDRSPKVVEQFLQIGTDSMIESVTPPTEDPAAADDDEAATETFPSDEDAENLIGTALDALLDRSDAAHLALGLAKAGLVATGGGYRAAYSRHDRVVAPHHIDDNSVVNDYCLRALRRGQPSAFSRWATPLRPSGEVSSANFDLAVVSLVTSYNGEGKEVQATISNVLDRLVTLGSVSNEKRIIQIEAELTTVVGTADWLADDDLLAERERHQSFIDAVVAVASPAAAHADAAVVAELTRYLASPTTWTASHARRWIRLMAALSDGLLQAALEALEALAPATVGAIADFDRALLGTHIETHRRMNNHEVPLELVKRQLATTHAVEALVGWLETDPGVAQVTDMLTASSGSPGPLSEPLRRWAAGQPSDDLVEMYKTLLDRAIDRRLLNAIATPSVLPAIAEILAQQVRGAAGQERDRLVGVATDLSGADAIGRPFALAALDLLSKDRSKTRSDAASRLLEVAGNDHRLKAKLQEASRSALQADKVDSSARKRLERLGYLTPRKSRLSKLSKMLGG